MILLHLRQASGPIDGIDVTILALAAGTLAIALALIFAPSGPASLLKTVFYPLFVGVVFVQGIHVVEHVIQLTQVYVFGVADDKSAGVARVCVRDPGHGGVAAPGV